MADLLVVDDNEDIASLIAICLSDEGHVVRVAHDGEQGLARMRERLPELVLLDVEIPILTGPDMAYRMLIEDAGKENVPIVFVSGSEGLPETAARVGTPYFLAKPFDIEALLSLLARALSQRALPAPSL